MQPVLVLSDPSGIILGLSRVTVITNQFQAFLPEYAVVVIFCVLVSTPQKCGKKG
jgi:hypothetical protein